MPTTLPPYLTSGASSRAHHALLVKLHEASSSQEEREIISKEVARIKDVLGTAGQNTVTESLIVLLHIHVLRSDTSDDLDFAIIHALQLAERGRTTQERRIGYLFIQERMREGNELSLMVINTVRKDLSSNEHSRMIMALHAIVKMPFRDLSPAVTPLLTSRRLLKHSSPVIRQRTIEAISALHVAPGAEEFPLSISKVVRMLSKEEDDGVLAVVLRLLQNLLRLDIDWLRSIEEVRFVLEQLSIVAEERYATAAQIGIQAVGVLAFVNPGEYTADCAAAVRNLVQRLLPNLDMRSSTDGALIFEMCRLIGCARTIDQTSVTRLIRHLGSALRPSGPSSSNAPFVPSPNVHFMVLRCLGSLPHAAWDGQLEESEMGVIMEGVNSPDNTIRRATLRLLGRISLNLLDVSFNNLLNALRSSSDLCLPLNPPTSFEEKTTAGRLETAGRALDVAEIRVHCLAAHELGADQALRWGGRFASSFVEILQALNEGAANSTIVLSVPGQGPATSTHQVWEEGLRHVLNYLEDPAKGRYSSGQIQQLSMFRAGIVEEIIQHRIGSATLAVLRCSLLADAVSELESSAKAIQVLLTDLKEFGPSVQELVLVALVVVLSQKPFEREEVIRAIRDVVLESGKYIKKRGGHVVDLIQRDLLSEVMINAKSRSLPDVLASITTVHATWRRTQRIDDQSTPTTPASPPRSAREGPSSLRYDAYAKPSSSSSPFDNSLPKDPRRTPPRRRLDASVSAGDLALFDADDEEDNVSPHSTRARQSTIKRASKAKPASLAIPDQDKAVSDPFSIDEARTPTMHGSSGVPVQDHML